MTPRAKQIRAGAITITISGAALVAALGWGPPKVVDIADARYVHTDSFALFKAELARKAQIDSVIAEAHWAKIEERIARADTVLREVRACLRRRGAC